MHIPLAGPLSLFLLGAGLGLIASYDMSLSAPWVLWLCAGSALYILIVSFARTDMRLRWTATGPVILATLAALALAAQYRYLGFEEKFGAVVRLGRITSAPFPPFIHISIQQNAAATFLEGALPLSIGLAAAFRGWWRLTWAGCAVVIAVGVLLTGSRGAWSALALGALLGGFATLRVVAHRQRIRVWVSGALVLAVAAAIIITVVDMSRWQHALESAAYRATDRWMLYRNCLLLALDFPFSGIGPGATFGMIYSRFQLLIPVFYLRYAHNLFLSIWLAQGLLGLLGFVGLLWAASRLVWRGLLRGHGGPPHQIGWGATIGCTIILLHGLTDAPQYDDAWYALLMAFGLFGIMVAATCLADNRPLRWVRLSRFRSAIAIIVVAGTMAVAGRPLLALASANIAAVLEARSTLGSNLNAAERTVLHHAALGWAERGLWFDANSHAALKERGMLAFTLSERNFDLAMRLLEPAFQRSPVDQSIRKALGYTYIWQGRIGEGVQLLRGIDRVGEIEGELRVWPYAWRDRGRPDLAAKAAQAMILMAKLSQQ